MHSLVDAECGQKEAPNLRRRFTNYAAVSYLMQISGWFYDLPFVIFVLSASLGMRDLADSSFAYKFAKDFLAYVWTPLSGIITPLLDPREGGSQPGGAAGRPCQSDAYLAAAIGPRCGRSGRADTRISSRSFIPNMPLPRC